MQWGTIAGMITAIATVLTALGGMVVSVTVLLPVLRQTRQVHKIVNQQKTDMERYRRALEAVLKAHDIELPVDQSIDLSQEIPKPRTSNGPDTGNQSR